MVFWRGLAKSVEPEGSSYKNGRSGVRASINSTLTSGSAVSALNGQHGFRATHGSVMELYYPTARANGDEGFLSQQNSHMVASYAWSHDNQGTGFSATLGATIDGSSSTSERNSSGYFATGSAAISAGRSYAIDNENSQVFADRQAYISFRCGERRPEAEELNPDGPPPDVPLRGERPLHTEAEAMIDALGCDDVPVGGMYGRDPWDQQDTPGHIINRDASPPCCGVP